MWRRRFIRVHNYQSSSGPLAMLSAAQEASRGVSQQLLRAIDAAIPATVRTALDGFSTGPRQVCRP